MKILQVLVISKRAGEEECTVTPLHHFLQVL